MPHEFLPIQSGVGNVANAALHGLADNPDIPRFEMYTEIGLIAMNTGYCFKKCV